MSEVPETIEDSVIKKSLRLVQISNPMSLYSRKGYTLLMEELHDHFENYNGEDLYVNLRKLADKTGYTSKNIKPFREALEVLQGVVIKYIYQDELSKPGDSDYVSYNCYSKLQWVRGVMTVAFHPELAKMAYNPDFFVGLNKEVYKQLSGKYMPAFYENVIRFAPNKKGYHGKTTKWTLKQFCEIMGVYGLKSYRTYKVLNSKIIKPCVAEMERLDKYLVVPLPFREKQGSSQITHIQFKLTLKEELKKLNDKKIKKGAIGKEKSEEYKEISNMILETGVKDSTVYNFIYRLSSSEVEEEDRLTEEGIKESILAAKEYKVMRPESNLAGLVVASINKKWETKSTQEKKQKLETQKKRIEAIEAKKAKEKLKNQEEEEEVRKVSREKNKSKNAVLKFISSVSENELQENYAKPFYENLKEIACFIQLDERLKEDANPMECEDEEIYEWFLQFVKDEEGIVGADISK